MRLIITLTVSLIGLAYLSSAQEAEGIKVEQGNEKERKRTCRIVFPERPNDLPTFAYLFDGKNSQQVHLPSMNFSPVVSLPSGDITLFMSANPISDIDIENLPPSTPRLTIPKEIDDFYILVTPDRANKTLPLKMMLVSLTNGKFKPGETLWFNSTKHQIVAKLGQAQMAVAPKGTAVSKDPLPKDGYYRADLGYRADGKGKINRVTEQMWWHDAKSRHLGFIVDTGGKLPKIYFFRDFRE
jgi:hypothetical protein